ncbi:very short patch repair endonuclease [Falsiroseomonas oryziterrae]|uniref:very short patch repair endonuclease n=1 Tax=Falsiroseomonas oryziterrae TaxID=2911368 RepID=UPI0023517121|nr:DNA mismatch endonuclease Vsr [Roseomonas sp. NPKOSM-4]
MVDSLTPPERSRIMAAVRAKNTRPEMAVRSLVHRMGYRFRLHRKGLPGRPDLVFPGRRAVIFVHGCFWHRHPDPTCPLARMPKSRLDFWRPKLEANKERDSANVSRLTEQGWRTLVVWECELRDMAAVAENVRRFLGEPGRWMRHAELG